MFISKYKFIVQRVGEVAFYMKMYFYLLIVVGGVLCACKDDLVSSDRDDAYVYIQLNGMMSQARSYEGEKNGENLDNKVFTLRVLVFDKNGNVLDAFDEPTSGNAKYTIFNTSVDVVRHPVKVSVDPYTMVFIANEPEGTTFFDNIKKLADLHEIAFPASAFDDNKMIPMMQVIKDVTVQAGGKVKLGSGTLTDINDYTRSALPDEGLYAPDAETSLLILRLDRLAVRMNVTLKSRFSTMAEDFQGITLTEIPDKVPLFKNDYTGTINLNGTREYPASRFSDGTIDATILWSKKLDRIVLPANLQPAKTNADKATELIVNMPDDKYSPSCKLKILDSDYNLPYNTWLDFEGTLNKSLEVNIEAKDWTDVSNNWQIGGVRILNVSQTKADITDYNGVRITFYSSMPVARVKNTVTVLSGGPTKSVTYGFVSDGSSEMYTNYIFNDLSANSSTSNTNIYWPYNPEPTRFYYDATTGFGYMDILVNGYTARGLTTPDPAVGYDNANTKEAGTYRLTLLAEEADGSNQMQRTIDVTVTQNGYRFNFSPNISSPTGYVGAFFRSDETGERIISGQNMVFKYASYNTPAEWEATVDYEGGGDWVVLSSTPSFDPGLGTDSPGEAENYKVNPNLYKGENGKKVKGTGRIYFRIGCKSANPNKGTKPRYARITLYHRNPAVAGHEFMTTYLYVRQGEEPDYLMRATDVMQIYPAGTTSGAGTLKARSNTRKFSPYNVTSSAFKQNPANKVAYDIVGLNAGAHVDYPTQGGAFFQLGVRLDRTTLHRRAFFPAFASGSVETESGGYIETDGSGGEWRDGLDWYGYNARWGSNDNNYLYWDYINPGITREILKDYLESCPPGYRRPNDGKTGYDESNNAAVKLALNNNPEQTMLSEWRTSLFVNPQSGSASDRANDNAEPADRAPGKFKEAKLDEITFGFYADGFFDRRPIKQYSNMSNVGGIFKSVKYYAVSGDNANIAFRGTLFHNPNPGSYASLFFPAAGRRSAESGGGPTNGRLEFRSSSGYYASASTANGWSITSSNRNVYWNMWGMEFSYMSSCPMTENIIDAVSLRCVLK